MKLNFNELINIFKKKDITGIYAIAAVAAVFIFAASLLISAVAGKKIDPSLDSDIIPRSAGEVIQVNVLNACGEPGAAKSAMKYLRKLGFDVVEIGNYPKKVDKSIIIDRVGDESSAEKVAYAMGIDEDLILTEIDSSLFLRGTIVIGNDLRSLKAFNK